METRIIREKQTGILFRIGIHPKWSNGTIVKAGSTIRLLFPTDLRSYITEENSNVVYSSK